jgi:hypothetical protein
MAAQAHHFHEELAAGEGVLALVEARFQGKITRSAAVPGPNPQWNQVGLVA